MDSTSAADSACSRRSSSKRSPSCRCICRSACTSASMSGMPERGKRGGAPAAIARAAAAMLGERPRDRAPGDRARARVPTSSASSAAPATAPWARRTTSIHLRQVRRDPDRARSARHGDVHEQTAHRLASPGGRRRLALRARRAPRDGRRGSRSAGSGPGGKSLSARTRPVRSTSVIRWPFCAASRCTAWSHAAESAGSASRISRASLSSPLPMSPSRSRRSERSAPQTRTSTTRTRMSDGAEHQPLREAHLARAPRSVPRNR